MEGTDPLLTLLVPLIRVAGSTTLGEGIGAGDSAEPSVLIFCRLGFRGFETACAVRTGSVSLAEWRAARVVAETDSSRIPHSRTNVILNCGNVSGFCRYP